MKKVIIVLVVCVLMASLAFAVSQQQVVQGAQITTQGQEPALEDAGEVSVEALEGTDVNGTKETEVKAAEDNTETKEIPVVSTVQTPERVKTGVYTIQDASVAKEGKQVQILEQANNRIQLKTDSVTAETAMEMTREQTQETTKLQVKLSNGINAEIKVMPSVASEKALETLRIHVCSAENNCTIELKEVGTGNNTRAAYEVQVEKQAKVLGLFKTKMHVRAQIDAETGEVIQTKKPWWAFLASDAEKLTEAVNNTEEATA